MTPSGVAGLTFLDEADTVNALVPELKAKGVETIVVLIHEGGAQWHRPRTTAASASPAPIVDIVNRFDAEVDVVLTRPHPQGLQLHDQRHARHRAAARSGGS